MEIILVVTGDNELIENIPKIKLQNHNILVLSNINYIKHYLEEYMPRYVLLSAKFKNYREVAEYINNFTGSELFITDMTSDSEEKKSAISKNIYLRKIENITELERVLKIIDDLNLKENIKKEDSYKFIPQQIISFYS
ncbi:MAG TPA: hypothetical protein VGB37_04240, partial [Candidatus Lokiarchaeia archaeon]